jgi:hypothetical protein
MLIVGFPLGGTSTPNINRECRHIWESNVDQFILNDKLWVLSDKIGAPLYDFDFRRYFDCKTPYQNSKIQQGVARVGAFADYKQFCKETLEIGIQLVNTPAEHSRCTDLEQWYPLIKNLTPFSKCYQQPPTFEEVTDSFELSVFVKGHRQTSKHQAAKSFVYSAEEYQSVILNFQADDILKWQNFVIRQIAKLRPVAGGIQGKIPCSFEFRTFWWKGNLVGEGRYWTEATPYDWSSGERTNAIRVAEKAVRLINVPFLAIDLAQTESGDWIVIECNDAMESGYAGVPPIKLWQNIIDLEAASTA